VEQEGLQHQQSIPMHVI